MSKLIGITCDFYKTERFRKRILENNFNIDFDAVLSTNNKIHLFRIKVEEKDYEEALAKIGKMLTQLEIECKQSN